MSAIVSFGSSSTWSEASPSISLVVDEDYGSLPPPHAKHCEQVEIVANEGGVPQDVEEEVVDQVTIELPLDKNNSYTREVPGECMVCQALCTKWTDASRQYCSTSGTLLIHFVSSFVLGVDPSATVQFTSTILCSNCFDLLDEIDERRESVFRLQNDLRRMTSNLRRQLLARTSISRGSYTDPESNNTDEDPKMGSSITEDESPVQDNSSVNDTLASDIYCPVCRQGQFRDKCHLSNHFDSCHSSYSYVLCQLCNQEVEGGIKHYLLHVASHHPRSSIVEGSARVVVTPPIDPILSGNESIGSAGKKLAGRERGKRKLKKINNDIGDAASSEGIDKYQSTCQICNKVMRKYSLRCHMMDVHNIGRKVKCRVCRLEFIKRSHYLKHLQVSHGKDNFHKKKTLPCHLCDKFFSCNYTLNQHISGVHLNRRDHLCNVCGAEYKNSTGLKVHLRKHSGSKPFSCKICEKSYTCADSVKRHLAKAHKIACNGRLNKALPININTSNR